MIFLANGCRCSELSVYPSNWNKPGASTKKDWYIFYRFYDPTILGPDGKIKPKLTPVKGMNVHKTLAARRAVTQDLLDNELKLLKERDYNPITGMMNEEALIQKEEQIDYEIHPNTPIMKALEEVRLMLNCKPNTKRTIKSTLKYVSLAAEQLRMTHYPIKDVKRRHIKKLLGRCKNNNPNWTNNLFNAYRRDLSMLFSELVELEAVDSNVVRDIKIQKHARQLKKVLTPEECAKVDEFVRNYDIRFWMVIHIFFHSGSRTAELFRVQGEHVDLNRQMVAYLVQKGNEYKWVERPIKDVALQFWKKAIEGCGAKDYVFSKGLKPGPIPIDPIQMTRRWRKHIKKKLKITCDWYSLKHLHTDQVAHYLTLKEAQEHNAQTNLKTARIYAINETVRENQRVMHLDNKFAG